MDLQRFFDISQAPDVSTFERRLIDFAADLGFGIVTAVMVVERAGQDTKFSHVGNIPQAYDEVFRSVGESRRDPVIRQLKKMSLPVLYDQALYVREGAADLWEQQAAFGFKTGVSVAMHLPGRKHFVLGVDRPDALPGDGRDLTHLVASLQLLAVHAHDAAGRLLAADAEADDAPQLTTREQEVLRWTMAGKSAWTVGQILSVSEHTVNFHLRNVFRKLDVVTKHQAVLKALSLGLL